MLKWRFPLAVTRNGLSVYFDLPAGDLHRIVAVPIDGAPGVETIIPALTARPLSMDVARDGSIYLDQITQPNEIVRIDPDGEPVERLPLSEGTGLVALPDGRFLVVTQVAGRSQLVEMAPGRDPVPFLDFEEDARPPLALVGNDAAAFVSGALDREHLTLVSHEGRLIRRVPIAAEGYVTGLTSMPDGSTLFYAAGGSVFRIAAEGGTPTLVSRGERVAFDPASGNLVIMRLESSGGTLVRGAAWGRIGDSDRSSGRLVGDDHEFRRAASGESRGPRRANSRPSGVSQLVVLAAGYR